MSMVTVEDLARIAFSHLWWTKGTFLMLAAYFDDSGTHGEAPIVTVGGLIGSVPDWQAFEIKWREKLRKPLPGKPELSQFHLSDCVYGYGEFEEYSDAERDSVRFDFREIIRESNLYGLSATILRPDWDELVTGELRAALGTAERQCMVNCFDQALDWAQKNSKHDKIALVYDCGRKTKELDVVFDVYRQRYCGLPEIVSITFGRVKEIPPLQGSDIIANEVYRAAKAWFENEGHGVTNAHFKSLSKEIGVENLYLDREAIRSVIANLASTKPGTP